MAADHAVGFVIFAFAFDLHIGTLKEQHSIWKPKDVEERLHLNRVRSRFLEQSCFLVLRWLGRITFERIAILVARISTIPARVGNL